jgi:hypothetical protein
MSGSSNPFAPRSGTADLSCLSLDFQTQLSSPKEDVVDRINVGDAMEVVLNTINSFSTVEVLWRGELAGGIASPEIQKLQRCLSDGVIYVATVIDKSGGEIRIRIVPYKS